MDAEIQPVARFLGIVEHCTTRLNAWGYAVALRFSAYDRAHARAMIISGAGVSIVCGFSMARDTHRDLTFAIRISSTPDRWLVAVAVEDEDEDHSRFCWGAPPIAVTTLDEFSAALDQAFALLDSTLDFPQVTEALKVSGTKYASLSALRKNA